MDAINTIAQMTTLAENVQDMRRSIAQHILYHRRQIRLHRSNWPCLSYHVDEIATYRHFARVLKYYKIK
jgi:hypothetical protein